MFRHPRQIGIERARVAVTLEAVELRIPIKGIRSGDTPPTAYDDLHASDQGHRTWKRSRRTRWRKPTVAMDDQCARTA